MDNAAKKQLLAALDNDVTPTLQKVFNSLEQLKRGIVNPELISIGSFDVIKSGIIIYDSYREDFIGLAVQSTTCIINDILDISKINKDTYRIGLEVIYLGVISHGEMYCSASSFNQTITELSPTIINIDFYSYDMISAVSTADSKYYFIKDLQKLIVVTPPSEAGADQFLWYFGVLGSGEDITTWFNGDSVEVIEFVATPAATENTSTD